MSGATLNLYWGIQSGTEAVKNAFELGSKLGTNTLSKDVLLKTLHEASAADIIVAANKLFLVYINKLILIYSCVDQNGLLLTNCFYSSDTIQTNCGTNRYCQK